MKKILFFILFTVFACNAFAAKLDRIVFFGDSLTDDGNLYAYLLHILPKSPPYYQGRFSNGETWAEKVGQHYYNKDYTAYNNYALGGATASFQIPSSRFISPATLEVEIFKYLIDATFKKKSNTLYSIWIGGNDYVFNANKDADRLTTKVVNKIIWSLTTLYRSGAKYFLVINLPDLGTVPEVINNGDSEKLHIVSLLHNEKLHIALYAFQNKFKDVKIVELDANAFYRAMLLNPDAFNKKYHTNITNLTDACWPGGILSMKKIAHFNLKNEIEGAILQSTVKNKEEIDEEAMEHFIRNNKALAETYVNGKAYLSGTLPCVNPDNYLYWDHMHPTATIHNVLSQIVIEALTKAEVGN